LNRYVIPPLAFALIYLISLTLKVVEIGRDIREKVETGQEPIICAFWHGRMFYYPYAFYKSPIRPSVLVSPSGDGEVIARVLKLFRFGLVRGSSYKKSVTALRRMVKVVKGGSSVVLIADGSRGPLYKFQPGAPILAKLTGRPVVLTSTSYSRYWTINSWDKMIIPKPFSTVALIYDHPVFVPSDCGDECLERTRKELEDRLRSITDQADGYFGKA